MPRFLCDAMLGSLARWLRFFGYDAEYMDPSTEDRLLAERARSESRWLLTRDRELAAIGPRTILLRSEGVEEQLVEVFGRLGVRPKVGLGRARCGECNGELEPADAGAVAPDVPPYVLRTAERFKRCRGCGRVYWPGSHGDRILAAMDRVAARLQSRSTSEPGRE
jgi:uncharacterized protein with PIN domain